MKTTKILYFFSFIHYFSNSLQQMLGFGECPDSKGIIKDFEVGQYVGIWYEQYRYFITPEIGSTCSQINLTHSDDGALKYEISYLSTWNDLYLTVTGSARFEAPDGEGKFVIDFPGRDNVSIKYRILDTDYDSYSVTWSCENKDGYNLRNVWIFTREQYPTNEVILKAIVALKKSKMPVKFLIKTDQYNCGQPDIEIDPDAEYIDDVDLNKDAEEI